jgi:hypothetical protein
MNDLRMNLGEVIMRCHTLIPRHLLHVIIQCVWRKYYYFKRDILT